MNKIQIDETLKVLTSRPEVQRALKFLEEDQENIIQKQIELTLIPAPTGMEAKKAARMVEMLAEEGMDEAVVDPCGNATGKLRGLPGGKTIMMDAHLDTVFALDTPLNLVRRDGEIHCPGIVDDTRGLAVTLSVIRALKACKIPFKGELRATGTVGEEGMGGMKGAKYYTLTHKDELDGAICIDGTGYKAVCYLATGIKTVEFTFHGIGGHAFMAFGEVANPIHAAARAIAKIADIQVPEFPRTTYAASNFHAGNMSAVHAITNEAKIVVNYRSNDPKEHKILEEKIFAAVNEAAAEETARWGKDTITVTYEYLCDINANVQDPQAPIVQATVATAQFLGCEEPLMDPNGCTNASRALEAGLPAVCLGDAEYDARIHSTQEFFKEEGAYKSAQQAFLLFLLCAGTEWTESVL